MHTCYLHSCNGHAEKLELVREFDDAEEECEEKRDLDQSKNDQPRKEQVANFPK
jgi:hypothetical protein